jgi:ABC-type bacteriocin/lantibiotic exporter with double-glycine peptidase domain
MVNLSFNLRKKVTYESQRFKRGFSTVRNCFILLSKREIIRIRIASLAQLLLSLLDFIGVILIGIVGALSVYGIQSRQPDGQLKLVLEVLNLENQALQTQVAIIGSIAGFSLVFKSVFSAWITRKTIFFLSNRSADISSRILEKLTFSNLEQIKRRSRFENMFALTTGVQSITVGVIGTLMTLVADIVLIVVMFAGLLLVEPSIALSTVIMFGLVALLLYKLVNQRVTFLAKEDARVQIRSSEMYYELLGSYREIFASGLRSIYVSKLNILRREGARISGMATFIPNISKYVLEIAFVFGAIMFVGIQFIFKDAVGAISSISVFLASSGRIVPAVLRLQGAALTFRGSLSMAKHTLDMIDELKYFDLPSEKKTLTMGNLTEFVGSVHLENVSFKYTDGSAEIIKEITMRINPGEWLAIVGPSGAGKTTLVDLILGILKPSTGKVAISGLDAERAVSVYTGSVAYVAQDSFILNGSIEENIALGKETSEIDQERVHLCLSLVGLSEFIEKREGNTKSEVGELGSKLSGGQRQRLGLARALYSKPSLLILDEATSSLDGYSEKGIIDCLNLLKEEVTIISIAHRLSTVVNADRVIYIENGKVLASGTFNEVRNKIPNFDLQAKLANIQ